MWERFERKKWRKLLHTYMMACGALAGATEGAVRLPLLPSGSLDAAPQGNIREKALVTLLDRAGGSGGAGGGMKPGAGGRSPLSTGGFDIIMKSQPPWAWILHIRIWTPWYPSANRSESKVCHV